MGGSYIGEFEQMVLLAMLQQGEKAYAIDVRKELERCAGRSVSRGALYRTFDRLEQKEYIEWELEDGNVEWELEDGNAVPDRGGHPMRLFRVTEAGLDALRASRSALLKLWHGLDAVLEKP
jgi:DNA-binding PadR family transcriptional regulator